MKIALDFDGTVTESFELWSWFVKMFRGAGHDVRIVTFRSRHEVTTDLLNFLQMTEDDSGTQIPIIFTGRVWKQQYCREAHNWDPDIWIDDAPALINHDDGIWEPEKLNAWKESLSNRVSEEPDDPDSSFELA